MTVPQVPQLTRDFAYHQRSVHHPQGANNITPFAFLLKWFFPPVMICDEPSFVETCANDMRRTRFCLLLKWLFSLQSERCLHGRLFCKITAAFAFQLQLEIVVRCSTVLFFTLEWSTVFQTNKKFTTAIKFDALLRYYYWGVALILVVLGCIVILFKNH